MVIRKKSDDVEWDRHCARGLIRHRGWPECGVAQAQRLSWEGFLEGSGVVRGGSSDRSPYSLFTVLPRAVLPGPPARPGHLHVAGRLQLHGHVLPQRPGGLRHHVPEGEALPGEGTAWASRLPASAAGAPGSWVCLTRSGFLGLSDCDSASHKAPEKKMNAQ